jgi:deferrochelatase/peroxidase EfeB
MAEPDLNGRVAMEKSTSFEFDDVQALLRFGHGKLTETCFMLLAIADARTARQWLSTAPVTNAVAGSQPPATALQIAFSATGLRTLGLEKSLLDGFPDEYIVGMAGDESRSRRLGDIRRNAPEHWHWGGDPDRMPDILLLLYARKGGIEAWRKTVEDERFAGAFRIQTILPTHDIGPIEPFGFADGISQPVIDWEQRQSTDLHERDRYSNLLAVGEMVLGYRNEYGLYTMRPLINPQEDGLAAGLPDAEDAPSFKDFGRNGTYLVIRQLHQDVPGFWQFLDKAAGSVPEKREELAAKMVGRQLDGAPLAPPIAEDIPGIPPDVQYNHFTYDLDQQGHHCPISAHIRRSNPRSGDLPPGVSGFFSRLLKILGFGQKRGDADLVASTRFHRLLRRGRGYGALLAPEDAIKPDAPTGERGLQFIVLGASISRQFEFVQNAWVMNSKFSGVQQESDPLLGMREPLANGEATDFFNRPDPTGPLRRTCHLPQFVTVLGGGYFFMPGLRALRYIASLPDTGSEKTP